MKVKAKVTMKSEYGEDGCEEDEHSEGKDSGGEESEREG